MYDQARGLKEMIAERDRSKRQNLKSSRGRQQVIAIASGKGGVGKSTFAVNLSIAISQLGKKVLVFDADLGLSNVNVILGETPKYNLFHVLKNEKKLTEIIYKSKYNVDMIAGASGFAELANLEESDRFKFLEQLDCFKYYDIIIMDTGAGISKNVTSFLLAASKTFIVTTPEPTAVTDAYGIIKVLATTDKSINLNLIVNKAENVAQGKKVSDRILSIAKQFLKININYFGIIYEDKNISKALYERVPIYVKYDKSKAVIAIKAIASRILNLPYDDLSDHNPVTKFIKELFE